MEDKDLLLSRIANHQLMFGSLIQTQVLYMVEWDSYFFSFTMHGIQKIPYLKILEVKYWMKSLMICIRR